MQLTIYIIEDQFNIRKQIYDTLRKIETTLTGYTLNIMMIENFQVFYNEIDQMELTEKDIFLLDIDLNTFHTGIDIGEKIRKKNTECPLIFLTAFQNKAIETINRQTNPMGYLIKNGDERLLFEEVRKLLMKYFKELEAKEQWREYVIFKANNTSFKVAADQILYISTLPGSRNTLYLKLIDREVIITGTLKKIKEDVLSQLPHFFLDNRTYAINIANVLSWAREEEQITFVNGETMDLGKKTIDKMKKVINKIY